MACDCISGCNNQLSEHNACLVTTLFAKPERVAIATEKVDVKKRGKPPYMIATFCPFCGERYAPAEDCAAAPSDGASSAPNAGNSGMNQ